MSNGDVTIFLALAVLGLAGSALFAGMETGLYTLNRVRLALRRKEGDRRALRVGALLDRPARMLAVILLGTNIAHALGSTAVTVLLEGSGLTEGWVVVVNTAILVPLLLLFGEILPKDLFRLHGDRWCYTFAAPVGWTRTILTICGVVPLVEFVGRMAANAVGTTSTASLGARHRMSDLLKEGVDSGVLSAGQTALLDRALELRHRTVADEMIDWSSVRTLHVDADVEERASSLTSPWTRLPVVTADGAVLGVVSVIDIGLSPDDSVQELQQDVCHFDVGLSVPIALTQLRQQGKPLGIVERDGHPVGLVTLKDLVETLTGELVAW